MILNLERHWYKRSLTWLTFLLLPLSYLFRLIVRLRQFLYQHQFIQSTHFSVPVIVVGNLTVGGTGKTPLVLWLAHFLKTQGWRPGIVSRGMGGGRQEVPLWVDAYADPRSVGDEAVLLARHSACSVVICIDRVAAVKALLGSTDCNIVLSDDGLQHYRLRHSISIAVLDGDRQLGNGHLLPAGPLRETSQRLQQVDFVVAQGGKGEQGYFSMQLQGNEVVSLANAQHKWPLTHFNNVKVHAVAGIGNPQRFFSTLRQHGLEIIEHIFPDHYLYKAEDFNFSESLPIIMTEKDKVKCEEFSDERFWYLPVTTVIDKEFAAQLLGKLTRTRCPMALP